MAGITKRERTQNWSIKEKQLLLKLMEMRLPILETRRTDQQSIKTKTEAWELLHKQFVDTLGIKRDLNRIREQWRRMKGQARTELMDYADRVKNLGKEQADQRPPTNLTKGVWRLMELAKQYMHSTDDSHEDTITQEINWSLNDGLIKPDCPSEEETDRNASPRFLCETEVKQEIIDSEKETQSDEYQFDPLITDEGSTDDKHENEFSSSSKPVYLQISSEESTSFNNKLKRQTVEDIYNVLLQDKRREHLKRMQMLDNEVQTSEIIRETAEINKQIARQTLKRLLIYNSPSKESIKLGLGHLNDSSNGTGKIGNNSTVNCETGDSLIKIDGNRDEDYVHKQQKEQLKKLKEDLNNEILFHEEQIRRHQEAINRHKDRMKLIEN